MNGLTFLHDVITIRLDRLECVKEFDQDGHSEPYIWTAFFRADAGTLVHPGQRVQVHVPLEDESGRGVFGDAGKGVRPGDVLEIPDVVGLRETTLKALSFGQEELMLAGFILVLLERDSTPADAIRAGHRMFAQALREEINDFVDSHLRFPEPDEIQAIRGSVSKRVKKAIRNELSWYHVFIKQDDLVAFLGGDDTLFTTSRIEQWRGKGPQSFRTPLRGTETFPVGGGGAVLEFEHHYDLLWRVEVVGPPEVVAPVHAPLLERVEAAGGAIRRLDARVRELAIALRSADDGRRLDLQAKIDRLARIERTRAVRELAYAWEGFLDAQDEGVGGMDGSGAGRPEAGPILLRKGSMRGFACQRKSKASGKCYHGFTKLGGCTEDCGIATIPDFERLKLAFHLRVAGMVVDDLGGGAIEGMEVHLFLPNRRSHVARTRVDGSFVLEVEPEVTTDGEAEREVQDVGILRTVYDEAVVEETGRIAIVCLLTDEFKAAYPDLDYQFLPVHSEAGAVQVLV